MSSTTSSELRPRHVSPSSVEQIHGIDNQTSATATSQASDTDEDDLPVKPSKPVSQTPQATDKTLDNCLKDFSPRWRNWIIRGIFSCLMILSFIILIYLGGPLALVLMIIAIQIMCFHEITKIGYIVYQSYDLPWFRTLCWYFLFVCNFFLFGQIMTGCFGGLVARTDFLRPFAIGHFISIYLYHAGLFGFLHSLVKTGQCWKQFTLFGWTHVTLLLVVVPSYFVIRNVFEGLIWVLVPHCMIICNDVTAYLFGFFFGRTPLIKLSPKKTWEGLIGGAFSTIIFGVVLSYFLLQYDYFVCPVTYDVSRGAFSMECERSSVFLIAQYSLPEILGIQKTINMCPFILHSIAMSLFASIIAPFGGFFASVFKRAFKIKDFGDTIRGHGRFTDRFDCQFLMGTFVLVYYFAFVKEPHLQDISQYYRMLNPEQKLKFLELYDLIRSGAVDTAFE